MNARPFEPQGSLANQPVDLKLFSPGAWQQLQAFVVPQSINAHARANGNFAYLKFSLFQWNYPD
jgi:hypothetical protein